MCKPTQFCSECFSDDFPFGLVSRVILLYRFHHQVHDVEQHSEICAVSQRDGWFSDSAATGRTVTEKNTQEIISWSSAYPFCTVVWRADHNNKCYSERQKRMWFLKNSIKTYSISMLRSSTRAEKVPTFSSRNMLYLIHCCTSASELQSANVPARKQIFTLREN